MSVEAKLWLASALCFAVVLALGAYVSRHANTRFDVESVAIRGQLPRLAYVFTESGRASALTIVGVGFILMSGFLRAGVLIPAAVLASQVVSQGAIEGLKAVFNRKRPDYWLIHNELGKSFPSGHASTAVVFYGTWAAIVAASSLPPTLKMILVVAFSTWAVGIVWSRLALGAHYLSDVFGGTIFGVAWLCSILALAHHFHLHVSVRA
ncbi:MAG: phosphatase PAP2 family protein [Candidatus Eremiobacteraeota bacterium]|nr:phosphatase PAP2 family protein [Candidatus Eremiobacteraeota bacterium]